MRLATSLGLTSSRSIRAAVCVRISFLFKAESYSIVWTDHDLLIHSSLDGHVVCFHIFTLVSDTAMNTGVQTPARIPAGYLPGHVSSTFKFLRNSHTVPQRLRHLISPQQCTGLPGLHGPASACFLLNSSPPDGCEAASPVMLSCVSPVMSDAGHLSACSPGLRSARGHRAGGRGLDGSQARAGDPTTRARAALTRPSGEASECSQLRKAPGLTCSRPQDLTPPRGPPPLLLQGS